MRLEVATSLNSGDRPVIHSSDIFGHNRRAEAKKKRML